MSNASNNKDGLFCLYCHHTNERHTTHCQHCGVRLVADDPELEIELRQQDQVLASESYKAQYDHCLHTLPDGGLALLISGYTKPLAFPQIKYLVLGRDAALTGEQMVDISQLSPLGHSVSRRHAAIVPAEGGFVCSDLGSTNGTWLNQDMLEPGKTYTLQSGDQIRLGLMTMVVCFRAEDTAVKRLNMLVKERNTLENYTHQLRPAFLLMELSPFLQALNELQAVISQCQNQPPRDIFIFNIQEKPAGIALSLEVDPKTLHILRQHLSPWRDHYTEFTNRDRKHPIGFLERAIEQLADQVLTAVSADKQPPGSVTERLESALTILAVTPLEAHWAD